MLYIKQHSTAINLGGSAPHVAHETEHARFAGVTPLCAVAAVPDGSVEVAHCLLGFGADASMTTKTGMTAFQARQA